MEGGEEGRRDSITLSFFSRGQAVPTPGLLSSLKTEVGVDGERPNTEKGGRERLMTIVMSEGHLGASCTSINELTIYQTRMPDCLLCVPLPSPLERSKEGKKGKLGFVSRGEIYGGRRGNAGQCDETHGLGFQSEPSCELAVWLRTKLSALSGLQAPYSHSKGLD